VWPEQGDVDAIGLAVPGAVNPYEGCVYISPNIPGWVDLPLRQIVQEKFKTPTAVGNDANLAALGEWRFGAGQGHHNLMFFTISTGIGGGVIENDRLLLGQRGLAAEVGHIMVDPDGPVCGCGQRGHLEAIASGPAIARWVTAQIATGTHSSLSGDDSITAREVAEAARKGDALASAAFERAGFWFGRTLADFLHLFNPSVVVLGGGVTRSGDLIFKPIRASVEKHAMSPIYYEDLVITRAQLGDDAGLVGALTLAHSLV
jgi:glucokinase